MPDTSMSSLSPSSFVLGVSAITYSAVKSGKRCVKRARCEDFELELLSRLIVSARFLDCGGLGRLVWDTIDLLTGSILEIEREEKGAP